MKKQIEDAEEIATLTQAKFRKAQAEAEDAEEKVHLTEQALFKLRSNSKTAPSFNKVRQMTNLERKEGNGTN